MKFLHRSDKRKATYHLADDSGQSLCQMEKADGFHFQYLLVNNPPRTKRLCKICGWMQFNPGKVPVVRTKKPIHRFINTFSSFYKTPEWKRLRYDRLEHSKGRCECCGLSAKEGATMNVDHIKPLKTHWHLRLSFDNTQVLCAGCNTGKGNRYSTQWR